MLNTQKKTAHLPSPIPQGNSTALRFDYTPKEISDICERSLAEALRRLNSIPDTKSPLSPLNGLLALETALAELTDEVGVITFLKDVSVDPQVRQTASDCDEASRNFLIDAFAREDLYQVVKRAKGQPD